MKKILIVCVLISLCSGCVWITGEHSNLLKQTATWSREISNRDLTSEQMKDALKTNADLWQKFQEAAR